MKKIIVLFVMCCIMLSGCNSVVEMGEDEVITDFSFRYDIDESNEGCTYYELNIDFSKEDIIMVVDTFPSGTKNNYTVTDKSKLMDYLRELVSHTDNQTEKSYKESPPKQLIWSFDVDTDTNSYNKTGFDDYPGYWNELWEVLIDSTDAETLDDFGFGDSDKYDFNLEYSLIESSIVESSDGISKDIKIPQLSNVDDYYSKVNEKIRNAITAFDVFSMEYTNYNGTYEITELTEKYISIKFIISALNEDDTEPIEFSYGITVELDTGCVVMLKDKIDSFGYLFRGIHNDKYKVEKGILMEMTPFEIREEILRAYNEEDYNSYKYNFYISNEKVYLILNGVKGKDYSVISYE